MSSSRLLLTLPLFLGTGAAACSSDDDGGQNGGSGASGGNGGIVIPGTGASSGGSSLPPGSNGLAPIPDDQRERFRADACQGWSAEPEVLPSVLVFVVDVSGTMRAETDSTNGQTKYEVTRDALRASIAALPADVSVGLTFYPNMNNGGSRDTPVDLDQCIDESANVSIALLGANGSDQRDAIEQALDDVEPDPQAATPTHDGFNVALEMLETAPPGLSKYAVILTDGQPTLMEGCIGRAAPRTPEDAQPIVAAIGAARQAGVRTFMIGSPGSERNEGTGEDVRDWLSAAARAGDTASSPTCSDDGPNFCHLDMTQAPDFGTALRAGLASIAGQVAVSCRYEVPPPPAGQALDPSRVNLIYGDGSGDSFAVQRNDAADCQAGWHYTSSDFTEIEICGETCEAITSNPNATMELLFGCATVQIPVR